MKRTLVRLGLVAAIISTLVGCGGGGGSDGAPGAPGAPGTPAAPAAPAGGGSATIPAGSAFASSSTAVAFAPNSTPATSESTAAWAALQPTVAVTSVSINSPPVVKFTVTDQNGKAVIGLGSKVQNTSSATQATSLVPAYANIGFTLAKLVPGTNGAPSKWVSYNILKPGTAAQAAAGYTQAATESCSADFKWCGTYPALDKEGTLVDNGDGSYQYTFYRDPKQVAALAATLVDSADGLSKKADLGDLSFDATATHRLGVLISGSAPGSGTNTPTGVASNAAPTAVAMVTPGNQWYDFRPDGGTVTTTRQIVNINSCASCHDGKVIGHSDRRDPNLCVTCHTNQIIYSFSREAPRTGLTLTGGGSTTQEKRANQAVIYGRSVGVYPSLIHKTHMGDELVLQGYNFNNNNGAQAFNANSLPMDRRNCTKCHSGDAPTNPLQAVQTPNGSNYKNVPNRLACGACHDGIDFATGLGTTVSGATTGHGIGGVGGAQADDSGCVGCHSASAIALVHRTNVPTANNAVVATGVSTISYEINSVSVVAQQAVIKFRFIKDGAPVTTLNIPTLVTNASTGQKVVSPTYEPITGFAGGPTLYVAFAVPQDGITSPADFNKSYSTALANVLIPSASGSPKAGTATGPDSNGWITATLTGDLVGQPSSSTCAGAAPPTLATCITSNTTPTGLTNGSTTGGVLASPFKIPTTAKMVTGALIGTFTQKVAPGVTTYVPADVTKNNVAVGPANTLGSVAKGNVAAYGGVVIKSMLQKMVASTYTARRVAVDVSKCNRCHEQLGAVEGNITSSGFVNNVGLIGAVGAGGFHGGARNDPTACAICHNTSQSSGGWTSNASTFVHGIHAGLGTTGLTSKGQNKRTVAYTWHATSVTTGFWTDVNYPGVLADCAQCHVPNAVNYGASGPTLLPTLLWSTAAYGSISAGATTAPYVTVGTNYGNNFSYNAEGATIGAYTPAGGTAVAAHVAGAGGETIQAQSTTLVSSPISAACFSCHDTTTAKSHMTGYGGVIYGARGTLTATSNAETCLVCHGVGKVEDAAVVHHQ